MGDLDLYEREKQGRSREVFNRTGFYPIWQSPLSRHNAGSINAIDVSADGKYLASGGEDGEIKVCSP